MTPYDDTDAKTRGALADGRGRRVSYLRVSITDRCDLRCVYCMSERMRFLPRSQVLDIEEIDAIAGVFVDLGVRKIRLTGGEPLVRKDALDLVRRLGRRIGPGGLDELTLTTNGARLAQAAPVLVEAGVRRINVSVDSMRPETYRRVTRGGDLARVLAGIAAARSAGLTVKINAVALRADNAEEIPDLIRWAHGEGMDITLIETMPLGETGVDRTEQYLPLDRVRTELESFWTLTDLAESTGGPARYVRIAETGGRLGFITPLTHNFCDTCNRVRLTCEGVLHTCLGREDAADLRAAYRAGGGEAVARAVVEALALKSAGHDFQITPGGAPALARHMSHTGG